MSFTSGVVRTSHKTGPRVVQSLQVRAPTADTNDTVYRKLGIRTPKKLPGTPSVAPTVSSEQTSAPKQEFPSKKLPQSKPQPVSSVSHSKSASSEVQKKGPRVGRSLSPVTSKPESAPLNGSEETKQPSLHRNRGRNRKPFSPQTCNGLNEPTEEKSMENSGSGVDVQEFDVDCSTVGSTETSNILAAMRVAMLEGAITKMPQSGPSTKKLTKNLSVKRRLSIQENRAVLPGKRKKLESSQQNSVKKKAKLSQSELEERFLRNKGYTHPDEVTDEPIICKGCGLQFDSGSAELRHRKTCIYVPSQEDAGLDEVEHLNSCLLSCVQSPSGSTGLKHSEQCRAAVSSNTEVTGESSVCHKKTAAVKAKCNNRDNSSSVTVGKQENVIGLKKSPGSNSENCTKIGRTKVKPKVTNTLKQITKTKNISDSRIIKGNVDNLGALKKGLTGAENISMSTTKQKFDSMDIVSASPVGTQQKPGTESTSSCPARRKKKVDVLENASSSPVGTKKKTDIKENASSSSLGAKKKVDSTENTKSSPRRTKKKMKDTQIIRDETVRTKTKSGLLNRIVAAEKEVDGTENAIVLTTEMKLGGREGTISSSTGIVKNVVRNFTGVKKKSRKSENSGGDVAVSSKKQVDIGGTVSSSPLGGRKKLGSAGKQSPVGKKRLPGCTENVNVGPFEMKQQAHITHSNSSNLVVEKECDQSKSERIKKQMECDDIVLVTETNTAKVKKRSVTGNIVLPAGKKEFGSTDIQKGGKRKPVSIENINDSTDKRKHEYCSTENETNSPASSDVDDKMPELQKEEPIENLKTETPSPKVEDLCDIPILSPVGCEPLGEDCEEKKNGDMLTKGMTKTVSVVEGKEKQPLAVEGKNQSKGPAKNCAGLRQTGATVKTRKSSAVFKRKDIRLETLQIPLHDEPSKQEASVDARVDVVEAGGVISQEEMDSDDKPLAECFGSFITLSKQSKQTVTCGATTTTDKDETQKVVQEHDIEKSKPLSKQQQHKPFRHRNTTSMCDRKDKKVATKSTMQLTEEDSNEELLPIAKLKEVIQKKILPLKELELSTSAAYDPGCLVVHINSEVTPGLESKRLAEGNVPVGIRPDKVLESESSVHRSTEEPSEISDCVSLAEKSPLMSRRAALKRGKRGRTQSWHQDTRNVNGQHQPQVCRKASLPGGVLEISESEGVPIGIRSKVEKLVISKKKAGKCTEQAESQNSTQMENVRFFIGHEKEENSLSLKRQDVEDKSQVGTKRRTKRKFGKIQSKNGEGVDSHDFQGVNSFVSKMQDLDNKTNCLASTRNETNISGVSKKKDPLLCEETGSGTGKKLLVAKRKIKRPCNEFGSEVVVVASPVGLMSDATPSVGKTKKTNQLVNEGHETRISGTAEESKANQSQRTSCLVRKKLEVTKTAPKTQLEKIRSTCISNGDQTCSSKQRGETDHLGGERVAGNEGSNSVVGKRLTVSKRKSKHMKESESNARGLAYSGISQRKDSNTVNEKAGESDHTDVHGFVCEEGETDRWVREPTEETVPSCREVTSVSICEEVKVRRRKTNFTDTNRKAVHMIDNNKGMGLGNRKKANFMAHKRRRTRQNIKLVIGKRRKVSPTDCEEQMCRLVVDGEEKQTISTEKDEASIMYVLERELGDEMEMDKDSGKDKLNDVVVEVENTSVSVADTDSRMDLICESETMNVLRCDMQKATNTLCDEPDDATNDLSTEVEDRSTFIGLREETSDLMGQKEHTENLTGDKKSSSQNDEKDTNGLAFDKREGLICQVERMDSVENAETKNMDSEKECRAAPTEDQEEINGEGLGSDMAIGKKETVPVKSERADSLVCQENCLNPVIIQQGEMNGQVVQMGSSLLAINIVDSAKVEESQADVEGPIRQARRTRCNTSYEELYTWSDVTSETEEESSQDLPDANILAALCQNTDVSTYEEIVAMIANGDFFPSGSKKKKKKKLRNNSRQYRNGHLRRKRQKKQKLKTRLIKNTKRPVMNEFIVTDIETGQEESQDSCESLLLGPALKKEHQPVDTETLTKPTTMKKKKKKTKVSVQEQAASNENVQVCNSSKPKQKRKSSVGSVFFCTLCSKHYSTNYNLMKHKLSLMHKRMSEKDQSSIPADVQNTEHEPPRPFQNTESEETSPVEQILETELLNSCNPNVATESSLSVNQSLETEQESSCSAPSVEMKQICSSVKNTEFENSCSSAVQSVRAEHPSSSGVLNLDAGHHSVAENIGAGKSGMVVSENTVFEEQCAVGQNVESEELCPVESERTYTLMQNMEVEQFSTCIQSISLPEREADEPSTYVSKPASHADKGHISEPGSPVQNLAGGVQQGTNPVQTLPAVGAINESATASSNDPGVYFEQPAACTEHQENVTSDWVGKERYIQQNMNVVNWPTSGEVQKQAGWYEGQVDNNQWLYTSQWPQEMAWGREVNCNMNWNAVTNQDDGTFFQSNSTSLGSILDSVNQVNFFGHHCLLKLYFKVPFFPVICKYLILIEDIPLCLLQN